MWQITAEWIKCKHILRPPQGGINLAADPDRPTHNAPPGSALVVVNPAAGSGRGERLLRHALPAWLAERGIRAELFRTAGPGDARPPPGPRD